MHVVNSANPITAAAAPPATTAAAPGQAPGAAPVAAGRDAAPAGGAEAPAGAAATAAAPLPQDLSSKDAYMLMYSRKGTKYGSCVPAPGCKGDLPQGTRKLLEARESERFAAEAEAEKKLVAMKGAVEERRSHIRSTIALMPPAPERPEDSFFVDSEWLARWANTPPEEELPAIDNGDLLCPHGRLEPTTWSAAKRIAGAAWRSLHARWCGGPSLPLESLCMQCTQEQLEQIVAACAPSLSDSGVLPLALSCSRGMPVRAAASGALSWPVLHRGAAFTPKGTVTQQELHASTSCAPLALPVVCGVRWRRGSCLMMVWKSCCRRTVQCVSFCAFHRLETCQHVTRHRMGSGMCAC